MSMAIVLRVGAFDLYADSPDDEPRVRDEDVGERMGYARVRDFRRLLRRLEEAGELPGIRQRAKLARYESRPGVWQEREVVEYDLTERDVIIATMAAKTEQAKALRQEIADVFVRARRDMRALTPPLMPVATAEIANGPRVRDCAEWMRDLRDHARLASRNNDATIHRVYGWIRKHYHLASPFDLGMVYWSLCRQQLIDLSLGRLPMLPAPPKLDAASVRQLRLRGLDS